MVNKAYFAQIRQYADCHRPVIYAYHGLKRQPASTPLDMKLPYIGLAFVGILSGLFHAVLNYHSQMGMSNPRLNLFSITNFWTISTFTCHNTLILMLGP
jgi:hypothetical protein